MNETNKVLFYPMLKRQSSLETHLFLSSNKTYPLLLIAAHLFLVSPLSLYVLESSIVIHKTSVFERVGAPFTESLGFVFPLSS